MNCLKTHQTSRQQNPRSLAAALCGGAAIHLFKTYASGGAASLHQRAIVSGHNADPTVVSSLIHAYAESGDLRSARGLLDEMPRRDIVPWSAIIGAFSNSGEPDAAMAAYGELRRENVEPNFITLLGLLAGIRDAAQLQCLHGSAVKSALHSDLPVTNSMINIYLRCGEISSARRMFDEMSHRDLVSWNTMISGHSRRGDLCACLKLFKKMKIFSGLEPGRQIFSSLVSCSAAASGHHHHLHLLGKSIHGQIIISGIAMDDLMETSLLNMYLKQKNVGYGLRLCDLSSQKDLIFWTAMTSGLVQNDRANDALKFFPRELTSGGAALSSAAIASLLVACAQLSSLKLGASIHGYILRKNIPADPPAQNSLLSMYAKCGRLRRSQLLFSAMQAKDLASWNSMISGFVQHGDLSMAMETTRKMMMETRFKPDSITVVLLLKSSASLSSLRHGRVLHGFVIRNSQERPLLSAAVATALVDMYCKSGELELARRCFNSVAAEERDVVLWSSMIAGYGVHGRGGAALDLFSSFLSVGIRPNKVIFLAALMACSHAGLVHEGLLIFTSMAEEFLETEHYACVVDMLGRKGMLQEAAAVAARGQRSAEVLGILLDACRLHGDKRLAEDVAEEMLAMEPGGAASYVQLVHGFAAAGRWEGVGESWRKMKTMGLKKTPGWSAVEVGGGGGAAAATFFVGEPSHPRQRELTSILRSLHQELKVNDDDDSNPLLQ